jgi:hypothetical protein
MKGPMVTQSLQGIVGQEPFHWRGDREDVAAFAPAYVGLQGADAEPSAEDMQRLTDFIASIRYAPSPNRNIDGTLPASFPTSDGGTGNPASGRNLFLTLGVLPGGLTCNGCHTLPVGTDHTIDNPPLPLAPQPLKVPQLRGLWEKVGWRRNAQNGTKGFGFQHHSEFDTLNALLGAGFNFGPPGPATQQRRRDVEAFLMCFDTETQAGVGQQVTFDGTNNNDAALVARLTTFANVADSGQGGLIAKGVVAGLERGWVYTGAGNMQSDRVSQTTTVGALRQGAATGAEITFTLVPPGTQRRMGIDRDADGYLDADEAGVCADPANAASHPGAVTCVDITGDLVVNSQDFFSFLTRFFDGDADFNNSGATNSQDFFDYLNAFFTGCR